MKESSFKYKYTETELFCHKLTEEQPFRSSFYSAGHSNARESNIQHYAVVDVTSEIQLVMNYMKW